MCDQAPPSCRKKQSCSQTTPSCAQKVPSCSQKNGPKQPKRVGIVGCGFTGTSAFYQLVSDCDVKEVDCCCLLLLLCVLVVIKIS